MPNEPLRLAQRAHLPRLPADPAADRGGFPMITDFAKRLLIAVIALAVLLTLNAELEDRDARTFLSEPK